MLRDRWDDLWRKLEARPSPQNTLDELGEAYSTPDRFYHNLHHIEDCLSIFEQTKSLAIHAEEVELAIWFHDAVYDPRRSDNELKSAAWAEAVVKQSGCNHDRAGRVSNSILATRHIQDVTDKDARLMVDVDLSILGRALPVFWQYEANIRKEYAWVPEGRFREKRIEILNGFLSRPHIYYHERYRVMFEELARSNLGQAIEKLRHAP